MEKASVRLKNALHALVERVKNNAFIKSVLTLSAGVVVSQVISLAKTPIISRIYDPGVLGDFSIIISDAAIISVVICLGLMTAIMIPKEEADSKGLCRLLLFFIVGLSTVLLLALLALSNVWQLFTVNLDYRLACVILYLYIITTNVSSLCYAYVNRQKMYQVLFWNPTLGTVTNALVSIVLGILKCGLWGYALGYILSSSAMILHLVSHANPFSLQKALRPNPLALLKKYKEFPLYQLPSNIVSSISQQLPVQLISRFFGNAVLGIYSMCLSILALPTRFLATPVNRVYYREAAERYSQGRSIGELSFKVLTTNVKIAILPICLLIILGEPLFAFALGEKWRQAGSFASILGVYQLALFCSSCISGGLVILKRQRLNLFFSIVSICINAFAFVFGFYCLKTLESTLILYALLSTAYHLSVNGVFLYHAGASIKKYLTFVALYIAAPTAVSVLLRMVLQKVGIL